MESCSLPPSTPCGLASAYLPFCTHMMSLLTWAHSSRSLAVFWMRYSLSHLCVFAWATPFLRMPFPFFTWHLLIHPLRFLSGKSSCSTRHVECLSSGLTLYITISQSQGFPEWTMIIDYLSAPTTTQEVL